MNSTDQSTSYHPRILLGVTGSVAAVKAPELATKLVEHFRAHVKVLLTAGGENFWHKAAEYNPVAWERMEELLMENRTLLEKRSGIEVHYSREEWQGWNRIGDPVLHIDLRNWADHLLIAPLSAHTLAKIATGLCDDTLSCVVRAWDFGYRTATNGNTDSLDGKALLLAPAMNTAMWKHPLTQQQLQLVCSFGGDGCSYEDCIWNGSKGKGVMIIEPATKELACGEIGVGALAAVETIVCAVGEHLSQR